MRIYYENTILNHMIVSVSEFLRAVPDENVTRFDDFLVMCPRDFYPPEEKGEKIMLFLSTSYPIDVIKERLPKVCFNQTVVVTRNQEDDSAGDEFFTIENWYPYWSGALKEAAANGIDHELLEALYLASNTCPSLAQRRVNEYVGSLMNLDRTRFLRELIQTDYRTAFEKGKRVIDINQDNISSDMKNSMRIVIDDLVYVFAMSSHIEAGYQIFEDGSGADCVVLAKRSLRYKSYMITLMLKSKKQHAFKKYITGSSGLVSTFQMSDNDFETILRGKPLETPERDGDDDGSSSEKPPERDGDDDSSSSEKPPERDGDDDGSSSEKPPERDGSSSEKPPERDGDSSEKPPERDDVSSEKPAAGKRKKKVLR